MEAITKYIDLHSILKKENSKLLRNLPRPIVSIIRHIILEDEMNSVIYKLREYEGIDFLEQLIKEFDIKIDIEGLENLPDNPKNFFVANHPFGLLDGMIITTIVGRKYGCLKAIGNDSFRFIPNLNSLVSNVSVFGKNSRRGLEELEKIFSSNDPITHFPFGLVSRIYKGKVQDKVWKKSFITKSIKHHRDVVPIRFYGRNSRLFYGIFLFRSLFGIKTTFELMLLPREFFRKRGATVKVKIFPAIASSTFTKEKSHPQWAEEIRNQIYQTE